MKKLAVLIGFLLISCAGTSAWADLMSGSLSTPVLYDDSAYGLQPQSARTPVADVPGGLVATAAWYSYGMKLDWTVSKNADNTYTYDYLFGPGWYPASNPKASADGTIEPYVTNKNITAFDLQLGTGITLSSLSNVSWSVYQYDKTKLGYGGINADGTQYWTQINPYGDGIDYSGTESMLSVRSLTGRTGYTDLSDPDNPVQHYTMNSLFYGIQWVNIGDPNNPGNSLFATGSDTNFELSFTTTYAPGLGNFFTSSTRTGANNNNSEVVAFDSSATGYDPSMLGGPITLNNTVTVAGGLAPVPVPPSLLLFGSGLSGLFFFRRKKVS
jgi:hypothetical protein